MPADPICAAFIAGALLPTPDRLCSAENAAPLSVEMSPRVIRKELAARVTWRSVREDAGSQEQVIESEAVSDLC